MPRISPFSPSSVNPGRVHSPGTGHAQGPGTTQPRSLERIGPLASLAGRKAQAMEGEHRPRTELPRSRDSGGGRSWLSSMKQAASKTGSALSHGFNRTSHAINHGFNRAGHALHKFGQALNEPSSEPSWMQHMSEEDRAHYDYYGELPAESSHSTHSSPRHEDIAPPWQNASATSVRVRPMTDAEQADENEAARYHGHEPRTTVEEYVSSPSPSRTSSGSSAGSVRTRPMTPEEQAAENEEARYYGVEPRTTIEEVVSPSRTESAASSRPASPPRTEAARPAPGSREILRDNIRNTVANISMNRLDRATPQDFARFAQLACKGTRYEKAMADTLRNDPARGQAMQERWHALREHLHNLRAEGHENVPSARWLMENRGMRMMEFLVNGNSGGKLVRPTTER